MADATENGTGLTGLPVWMRFVAMVGIPAALLAYVLWAQNPKLDAISAQSLKFASDLELQKDQTWALYGVLQRICINTAKSDEDKKACTTITQRPR